MDAIIESLSFSGRDRKNEQPAFMLCVVPSLVLTIHWEKYSLNFSGNILLAGVLDA
jgi:hypothetical protein